MAAEEDEHISKGAQTGLSSLTDYHPKSHLAGPLFCGDVNNTRAIEGNSNLQEK